MDVKERSASAASLEVRIPISPRSDYFNRVWLIARSIREFYPGAIVRVTIGSDSPESCAQDIPSWSEELGVQWVHVAPNEFEEWRGTAHPYIATMMERFRPPFLGEYVLMLDADIMPIRPFDELFRPDDSMLSMMAHASPFRRHVDEWRDLYEVYGLPEPRFECEHSGWGAMFQDPSRRFSPPYFNTGVVFGRSDMYENLYEPYMAALRFVRSRMDSYFFEQIALTLALEKIGLPFDLLPLRYNFPNQSAFDEAHRGELQNVSLLHFLRTQIVDREKNFETIADIRRLTERTDLLGSNEILRRRIEQLLK